MFQFCQKELAPKAQEIDKTNTFADMKVIFEIYISCWFCVILVQVVDVYWKIKLSHFDYTQLLASLSTPFHQPLSLCRKAQFSQFLFLSQFSLHTSFRWQLPTVSSFCMLYFYLWNISIRLYYIIYLVYFVLFCCCFTLVWHSKLLQFC